MKLISSAVTPELMRLVCSTVDLNPCETYQLFGLFRRIRDRRLTVSSTSIWHSRSFYHLPQSGDLA
jgi:hypothetical protein